MALVNNRLFKFAPSALLILAALAPTTTTWAADPVPQCAVANTLNDKVVLVYNTMPTPELVDMAAGGCGSLLQRPGWSGADYTTNWGMMGFSSVCHVELLPGTVTSDLWAASTTDIDFARLNFCQTLAGQGYAVSYPVASLSTPTHAPVQAPQVPGRLELAASGFTQVRSTATYAFVLQNNVGSAVSNAGYRVAIYDRAGTLLKTDSGQLPVLSAGQRFGYSGEMYLPDGTSATRIEVQLSGAKSGYIGAYPSFVTTGNVAYRADKNFPKAAGVIQNQYPGDITHVRVSAIAYDGAGNIIGGGRTYLDFVPAGGAAVAEVGIATAGPPARLELYAGVSSISGF
jgi:hypothetical protein